MRIPRRELLKLSAMATAGTVIGCNGSGEGELTLEDNVAHLLPTVSSDRILLKASFLDPLTDVPDLYVDGVRVPGVMTDTDGEFFAFDAAGLEAGREYELQLRVGRAHQIEPWTLRTFPAADADVDRLRILAFTCAGGHQALPISLPTATRVRLFQRALSFAPDIAIANGDHVYWDLTMGLSASILGKSPEAIAIAGEFDRDMPVLGMENEQVLKRAVDGQIAQLYGTLFQNVPIFFMRDDHDYFENDEYRNDMPPRYTFPPSDFSIELARATQWLNYPELLPFAGQPANLPGAGASDRPDGINESFGTIRYGKLFEGLMYDCKGHITLDDEDGVFVPPSVEGWLLERMRDSDAEHVINLPSSPVGWSAGKFAEWYPDVLVDGELSIEVPKAGWQQGWLAQHDRILSAASAMDRLAMVVSGDIHSHAEATIYGSANADFSANPIISIITGTPATFGLGWPTSVRATRALPSKVLEVEEELEALEENGFNIIDVEPTRVTVRSFRFDGENDDPEIIDTLEPFRESVFERG